MSKQPGMKRVVKRVVKKKALLSRSKTRVKRFVQKRKKTQVVRTSISRPSAFHLGRVLEYGKLIRPTKLVVMLHGMGDNASGCARGWADHWAARLPGALVVVPEPTERTLWDEGKGQNWSEKFSEQRIGRDWHRQHGSHNVKNQVANVAKIQKVARWRMRQINAWLDSLLAKHGLSNNDLILVGFSQGTNVALLAGAKRGAKSVLLCGGPGTEFVYSKAHKPNDFFGKAIWPQWENLLPKAAPKTKFWLLNGTDDYSLPRCRVEPMLKVYNTTFRWEEGLKHHELFHNRFKRVMLRRLQEDFVDER